LEGGPPCFPQGFTCLVVLRIPVPCAPRSSTGVSPALLRRSRRFESRCARLFLVLQPRLLADANTRFGLLPGRSPLLRESRLISLSRATEMFQFTHCPPPCLCIQQGVSSHHAGGVAPFGFSGLVARMQLPLNVSPVSASFIGLQRRGILLVLSIACASLAPLVCLHSVCLRSSSRSRSSCSRQN
jgi:hypothetical protein